MCLLPCYIVPAMFYSGPAFLALFILNGLKMHNGVSMFNNSEVNIGGSVRVTVHVDTPRGMLSDGAVDRTSPTMVLIYLRQSQIAT